MMATTEEESTDILSSIENQTRNQPNLSQSHKISIPVVSVPPPTIKRKLKIKIKNSELDNMPVTNKELADLEKKEYTEYLTNTNTINVANVDNILYPTLNDPLFNVKIASRKEFYDTQYDGGITDVKTKANELCNSEFELMPHQLFVKNFLSFQTPYNSLFLYHELGTGKTCSAIGIAEDMRQYLKNVSIKQKIVVVAFPIVQDNFKRQLFDENKLKEENGVWNIKCCVGNSLLNEINPMNVVGLSRDVVIGNIKAIISKYYSFKGYIEFSNEISKIVEVDANIPEKDRKRIITENINKHYNNSLVIIDEVHNIRTVNESNYKRTMRNLLEIVKYSKFIRLLLLSATPMYDSYKEIIWIANIMNLTDKRSQIKTSDVFDKNGNFKPEQTTDTGDVIESGESLLKRKLIGYISFIRGENPYTFPYRIYPSLFSPSNTLSSENFTIPTVQYNNKIVDPPLKLLNLYMTKLGTYQEDVYSAIISSMSSFSKTGKNTNTDNNGAEDDAEHNDADESMSQKLLIIPNQALNIVYPSESFEPERSYTDIKTCVGKTGLRSCFDYIDNSFKTPPEKRDFEYKPEILEKYGRILHPDNIHKYSGKISNICEFIKKSTGIVMIFSQYIDSGVVPMALAMEEMGFARFNSVNSVQLLKSQESPPLNVFTMRPQSGDDPKFSQAKYVMITGDKSISPSNFADLDVLTNKSNAYGENIKVVIISRAGAEGLDFKNIRQIHIMDAWYNMNRVQQIIGRGVRNLSHCSLPFEERNVEIYLHASVLNETPEQECVDLYVYRMAERKAVQIGKVTRLLKETAVDCILNIKQTNFTVENMIRVSENQEVVMTLSSGTTVPFKIGDKAYSETCDYMDNCAFSCDNTNTVDEDKLITSTYSIEFIRNNNDIITKKIKDLFKEQFFYKKQHLINAINISKQYPLEHIYYALTYLIKNKTEFIVDKYGRTGSLINKDEYYLFQPNEITDDKISVYERSVPLEYKRGVVSFELPDELPENLNDDTHDEDEDEEENDEKNEDDDNDEKKEYSDKSAVDKRTIKRYIGIVKNLLNKFKSATDYEPLASSQNKWDWTEHASRIMAHLREFQGIDIGKYEIFVIRHLFDSLFIEDRLAIITALYSSQTQLLDDALSPVKREFGRLFDVFYSTMMRYFEEIVMVVGNENNFRRGVLLVNNDNDVILYVQNTNDKNEWDIGMQTDYERNNANTNGRNFGEAINRFIVNPNRISKFMGFYSVFKNREVVFKVKDMSQIDKRQYKGTRPDQNGKDPVVKILNSIQNNIVYNRANVKNISQMGLSIVLEFVLRNLNETNPERKYFLSAMESYLLKDIIHI